MTAIVTGASSGIGQVFARKLAERGYKVITVARREGTVRADLATEEGVSAVEQVISECSDLELLVNNAGFGTRGYFWETDPEGQDRMHRLHVLATMRLTQRALRGMVARDSGTIINVSSVAAFSQSPDNVSYCATKAWMNSFTEGLAIELRDAGSRVRVQALCPGFTRTGFHEAMGFASSNIPAWLWTNADDVVEQSLNSNRVVVIPGAKYRIAAAFMRHLPWSIRKRVRRPGKHD